MVRTRRRPLEAQESYFVSMTDLMIGLLFLFIIMLMSFAIQYSKAQKDNRQAADQLEQRAETLELTNDRLTDNRKTLRYILQEMRSSLDARGIKVQIDPRTGVLRLPESVLFDSGAAELNQRGRFAVASVALALDAMLPCFAHSPTRRTNCPPDRHGRLEAVLVEGHTDDRPISGGRYRSNWDLSAARAIETYQALMTALPMLQETRNDKDERLIGVGGYGEFRPVASNDSEEGRKNNRRIDLRFLMATPDAQDQTGLQRLESYRQETP